MEFKKVIQERYSCRRYTDKPVEKEKLDAVLEAGRLAPTAKNLQEQHIYVACSPEALAKVDQITPCRYGAPVVLIVAYDKNNVFTYPGERVDSGREDTTIVATHMILAATDEGLNSLWINRIDPDEVIKVFGLPENEDVLMVMDIGYGDENYGPSTNHENRKDLSETVTYL